jgi:hypothetical protein
MHLTTAFQTAAPLIPFVMITRLSPRAGWNRQ